MKSRTKIAASIAAAIVVLCLGLGGLAVVGVVGPEPHFVCHKGIDGALQTWMLETSNTFSYPNIGGSTSESTAVLTPYIKDGTNALQDYRYIPGLKSDDPENLILFYMSKPSRRTWHGDTHWFRISRRWVVLNPRMSTPDDVDSRGWSECGEAISTSQLKRRLKVTLEFLKVRHRPGWQAIVDEHTKFLNTIE